MRPGTSSGKPQSAVLIPVPDAESVVAPWRHVHDPVAAVGVPAHVTLMVPWLPPEQIDDEVVGRLRHVLSDVVAFDFSLTGIGWFGHRVLWLAPEPAGPFCELTERLSASFGTLPWDGAFADVVPHLTVGHAGVGEGSALGAAAMFVSEQLPVRCRAREVWVMVHDGATWSVQHRVPLHTSPPDH